MTSKSTSAGQPKTAAARRKSPTAATRAAKGSVHEAIGKLIGDDAAREHGSAEQRAAANQRGTPEQD